MEKCIGFAFATDKHQTLPSWVLKNLVVLEDCVLEITNDQKKKMNKLNAQAYTKVKQKLKKYFMETGDDENTFEQQIQKYRENPPEDEEPEKASEGDDSDDSDDSSSSGSSSSSEEEKKEVKKPKSKPKKKSSKGSDSSSGSGSSSSSGSSSEDDSSGSGSGSSGSESEKGSEHESDEEEVVKSGELPKKYAWLSLPREQMTPQQRRYKWVSYDFLPEDMKQFIRPPTKQKADKPKEKKAVAGKTGNKEEEIKELVVQTEDDKDLDFKKYENVEKILTKYRNQQTSRKKFNIDQQIEVLTIMFDAQEVTKNDIRIEILILLISTYFIYAKKTPSGYFDRNTWTIAKSKILDLVDLLKNKNFNLTQAKISEEDGGNIDQFLQSSDHQILPALVNFVEKLDH